MLLQVINNRQQLAQELEIVAGRGAKQNREIVHCVSLYAYASQAEVQKRGDAVPPGLDEQIRPVEILLTQMPDPNPCIVVNITPRGQKQQLDLTAVLCSAYFG